MFKRNVITSEAASLLNCVGGHQETRNEKMEPSEVLLFVHSIATVVYGAFRSSGLKHFFEDNDDGMNTINKVIKSSELSLSPTKSILITGISCIGILVCFYYFAVVSFIYTALTLITSSFGLLYCIHPLFNRVLPFKNREFVTCQERVSFNTLLLYVFSLSVTFAWLVLGNNIFLNNSNLYPNINFVICFVLALGTSICVLSMAIIKIPNFKTGTVLLTSLFVYDIFWVFYSPYFFKENVMY